MEYSNKKKSFIIAGALATSLLIGGVAVAGGKNCSDREGHRGQMSAEQSQKKIDRLASRLELSEEQKTQMQTILQANREKQQALRQQNREAFKAELSTVLSAEQMEEFETMMDKRGGKHNKRMQNNADS